MLSLLHNYEPRAIIVSLGPLNLHWYGLILVIGITAAMLTAKKIAPRYSISAEKILDLSFWLILWGIIGARLYDVLLEIPYYINNPWQIFKIWEGGLAIHGGILAGLAVIYIFAKKWKISFWDLAATIVPGLALAQSIGRWGNYFNQELFGRPTNSPWGIYISPTNRPAAYQENSYFTPTFLYESAGSFIIFLLLLIMAGRKKIKPFWLSAFYVISYSILRLCLEFIRIDRAPTIAGWRWPQIMSLMLIAVFLILTFYHARKKNPDRALKNQGETK